MSTALSFLDNPSDQEAMATSASNALAEHFRIPLECFSGTPERGGNGRGETADIADFASSPSSREAPFDQNSALGWLDDYENRLRSGSGNGSPLEDMAYVIEWLRTERYLGNATNSNGANGRTRFIRESYYRVRPFLPVAIRRHLQKFALRGWNRIPFPQWPVDTTVERLMKAGLGALLQNAELSSVPFIWFWPERHDACLIMTHDVETEKGRDFCAELMGMNDDAGFKASFQIVPEVRYRVSESFLDRIKTRGHEVNLHGLNHDGRLFDDSDEFGERAQRINRYLESFGAVGFRSPVMYRNLEWMDRLDITYDMSVPNVAHLDPQRGGCATVFPFFIGDIVELPLTTIQDYPLFFNLRDYSLDLWQRQFRTIHQEHGLISFLVHPDYIISRRPRRLYAELLQWLSEERDRNNIWAPLPREAAEWWRARRKMKLVREDGSWRVVGQGSERASVAHARMKDGEVVFEIENRRD